MCVRTRAQRMSSECNLLIAIDRDTAARMATRNAVSVVPHRRLARQLNIGRVVWTPQAHWRLCGQSCPCCRAANGEGFGSCHACEACANAMTVGALIAAFAREKHATQALLAAWGGYIGAPGRTMPHAVMIAITDMLPQTSTTYPSSGIASVAVLASGLL